MPNTPNKIKSAVKILGLILSIVLFLFFYGFPGKEYIAKEVRNNKDENTSANQQLKDQQDTLTVAWDTWFPYEYLKIKNLASSLTGLDAELTKSVAQTANQAIKFKYTPWDTTLNDLEQGKIDMATGASYSDERAKRVYFSKPYRFEEDSLFVLRSNEKNYHFATVAEFLDFLKNSTFRLGVLQGYIYPEPSINLFIKDKSNAARVIILKNEEEAIEQLKNENIDGFLADRIVASTYIWEEKLDNIIVEHYLKMKTGVHFIFSKKTVTKETVAAFNQAIDYLQNKERYKQIFSWYLYPVITVQTTGQDWFILLDILGTVFFSISGVLIAYSLNSSLLAAFMYAFLPSIAGVMIRDVIFNHRPVVALSNPEYMYTVCITVFLGYFIVLCYDKFRKTNFMNDTRFNIKKGIDIFNFHIKQVLVICDALGLAALTVSGVMISLMAKVEPLWLWGPFFSFISASAGKIIRDIISKNEFLEIVIGEIDSEIAVFWGLFLSIAFIMNANDITPELVRNLILTTVIGAFITRLLVYYFKVPNVHFK